MKHITLLLLLLANVSSAGEAIVTLTWTARPTNENTQFYIVSESLSPGRNIIGTTTSTNYVIHQVTNGEHFYFVSAQNSFGEGIPTMSFRVNIFNYPFGSPGIPANLNGTVNYTFP